MVDDDANIRALAAGVDLAKCYVRNTDGRAIVWGAEAFPGCHKSGLALRSRIVWWLNTGEVIKGLDANIHHRNGDRQDDRFANLEKLPHLEHAHQHNPKGTTAVECVCATCGKGFSLPRWRVTEGRGKYCSLACFHDAPVGEVTKLKTRLSMRKAYQEGRR